MARGMLRRCLVVVVRPALNSSIETRLTQTRSTCQQHKLFMCAGDDKHVRHLRRQQSTAQPTLPEDYGLTAESPNKKRT